MSNLIDDWLEAQRINGGPHGFECIGIARMQQVWDAAQEDLRQQLVTALAACKVKDNAMLAVLCDTEGNPCFAGSDGDRKVIADALAIQPDDSALREWPGEPAAWMTTDEEGSPAMLFFDKQEASMFSDDDEPVPLYAKNAEPT